MRRVRAALGAAITVWEHAKAAAMWLVEAVVWVGSALIAMFTLAEIIRRVASW